MFVYILQFPTGLFLEFVFKLERAGTAQNHKLGGDGEVYLSVDLNYLSYLSIYLSIYPSIYLSLLYVYVY